MRGSLRTTATMTFNQVLKTLESQANPAAVLGMARFGITAAKAYGWSTPALKKFAREIGKDHDLAQRLWSTGILEARALAGLIAERERSVGTSDGRLGEGFRFLGGVRWNLPQPFPLHAFCLQEMPGVERAAGGVREEGGVRADGVPGRQR